jgi:hypothetical protein
METNRDKIEYDNLAIHEELVALRWRNVTMKCVKIRIKISCLSGPKNHVRS